MSSQRTRRLRLATILPLDDGEDEVNPLASMANLFDVAMVFAVALMVALVSYLRVPALLQEKDYQGAEACFRQAVAAQPTNAALHYQLGLALDGQGRSADAERALRRAMELEPANVDIQKSLQRVLDRREQTPRDPKASLP